MHNLIWASIGVAIISSGAAFAASSNLSDKGVNYHPDVNITLITHVGSNGMTFRGVGDAIEDVDNPTLTVPLNSVVQITLIDGDGSEHDISIPAFKVLSNHVVGKRASTVVVFRADTAGRYDYFCTLPGHRQAGMQGTLVVGNAPPAAPTPAASSIVMNPADVPPPVGTRAPKHLTFHLEVQEVTAALAPQTTYTYWTFDGKVPGPMLRARVGDTITITLKNPNTSHMIHSIDLHAVTGPGGGASVMQVPPGEERSFTFKALVPGAFVYHCATPMVSQHIANGMFGLIVIEPAGGLPKVSHEYYVMQSEIYTTQPFGFVGLQQFDVQRLLDEQPTYFVMNGAVGALTQDYPLHAKVGESVRIFFGDAGPDFTSSFHMIGEIFDNDYAWGSFENPPLHGIQTISVPPGGAVVAEVTPEVPGKYIILDHAITRLEKGLAGYMLVTGPEDKSIFHAGVADTDAKHE
ncbi:MAG: nitrite reductase, copper-containing [Gammaproteobacteria bacterium]|nr:nitrite reductase, copper-containing [Gammaproteobacteria bacterium]